LPNKNTINSIATLVKTKVSKWITRKKKQRGCADRPKMQGVSKSTTPGYTSAATAGRHQSIASIDQAISALKFA
jgi:hypothetical protein